MHQRGFAFVWICMGMALTFVLLAGRLGGWNDLSSPTNAIPVLFLEFAAIFFVTRIAVRGAAGKARRKVARDAQKS